VQVIKVATIFIHSLITVTRQSFYLTENMQYNVQIPGVQILSALETFVTMPYINLHLLLPLPLPVA